MPTKFIKNPNGSNYLLENVGEGWHISYNPHPCAGISCFASDNHQSETAIRTPNGEWAILNGDFRKEYLKIFPMGLQACLDFFKSNIEYRSSWSDYQDK